MQLQHKQVAFKADAVNDDGTFSGYGSVFGNIDAYGEIVAAGAFDVSLKAIADSGDPLPALWQHDPSCPIGGYTSLSEDDRGLKVEGFLMVAQVPQAATAHALMQRRVVKGLSIGYYVINSSIDEKSGIRTLTEIDLQEISIVTFPANDEALIDSVKRKMASGTMPTMKEFERLLREAGFTNTQAKTIANRGFGKFCRREVGDEDGSVANDVSIALAHLRLNC